MSTGSVMTIQQTDNKHETEFENNDTEIDIDQGLNIYCDEMGVYKIKISKTLHQFLKSLTPILNSDDPESDLDPDIGIYMDNTGTYKLNPKSNIYTMFKHNPFNNNIEISIEN